MSGIPGKRTSTVDAPMPRDGSMTPRDLVGKLDVLHVECAKCDRHGRYRVDQLVVASGRTRSSRTGSPHSQATARANGRPASPTPAVSGVPTC